MMLAILKFIGELDRTVYSPLRITYIKDNNVIAPVNRMKNVEKDIIWWTCNATKTTSAILRSARKAVLIHSLHWEHLGNLNTLKINSRHAKKLNTINGINDTPSLNLSSRKIRKMLIDSPKNQTHIYGGWNQYIYSKLQLYKQSLFT